MERLSFDEQLEDLREISGTVDEYISRELYKADFGADMENTYNPNAILAECYGIIIDELTEFGITFPESDDELLTDWYTAKHIYYIRAFVDSDNLLRILSTRGDLEKLSNLLNTDEYDDLYQLVVDFIFTRKTAEIYQILSDFSERVTVNNRFKEHLLGCIDRITETGSEYNIPVNELSLVRQYIAKVQKDRRVLNQLIQKLLDQYPDTNYDLTTPEAVRLIRTYDLDKLEPCNIRKFATLDRDDALDQKSREELVNLHHTATPFHGEYYVHANIVLDTMRYKLVILAMAADLPKREELLAEVDHCAKQVLLLTSEETKQDIVNFVNELCHVMYAGDK